MPEADAPQTAAPKGSAPRHVAIIMDGNGRWAAARGLPRGEGHRRGVEAIRRTVRAAGERGIADACVEIDGSAPSARVTELLAGIDDAPRLAEATRCGEGSTLARIRIDDYQTDGSGTGSVRMRVQQGAMRVDQRFEVVREGYDWRITGSSRP